MLILQALWFIFPASVANASPVVIRGTKPLDFGKKLRNNRIFGDGKTFEGTVGGVAFGALTGVLQLYIIQFLPSDLGLQAHTIELIIALSVGAILGDIIGAFVKRRLGVPRGHPALLLDQLGFLLTSLLFASFVFDMNIVMMAVLVVVTPVVHLATNMFAYFMKIKKTPW